MTKPTSLVIRTGASVAAFIVIAASASVYFAVVTEFPRSDLGNAILESNLERLGKETQIAANRRGTGQIFITGPDAARSAEFERLAANALTFMEPEGMESLLGEVARWPKDGNLSASYTERLKTTASGLLAGRARKRRFDSHQLLQRIDAVDAQLAIGSDQADLQLEIADTHLKN